MFDLVHLENNFDKCKFETEEMKQGGRLALCKLNTTYFVYLSNILDISPH